MHRTRLLQLHPIKLLIFSKLHGAGVKGHEPEAAYYFMPNFASCKTVEIFDGQQLCDKFLDKGNIALQPCDPHYLRPIGELTTRLAFVNFKGKSAMDSIDMAKKYSVEEQEEFLKQHCSTLVEGIETLIEWVQVFRVEKIIDDASNI